jgi:hypothetical protein
MGDGGGVVDVHAQKVANVMRAKGVRSLLTQDN